MTNRSISYDQGGRWEDLMAGPSDEHPFMRQRYDNNNHLTEVQHLTPSGQLDEREVYDASGRRSLLESVGADGEPHSRQLFHYNRDGSWEMRQLYRDQALGGQFRVFETESHRANGEWSRESVERDGSGTRTRFDSHNNRTGQESIAGDRNRLGIQTSIPREAAHSQGEDAGEHRLHTTAQERQEGGGAPLPSDKEHKSPPPESSERGGTHH